MVRISPVILIALALPLTISCCADSSRRSQAQGSSPHEIPENATPRETDRTVVSSSPARAAQEDSTMALQIRSQAFEMGAAIPTRFTCDGDDLSPGLAWTGAPAGTRSFALICDDPDAPVGTWVHWTIYNIPAAASDLPEGVPADAELSGGARQGRNSWKRIGYGGPCPPPGKPHRYFFKLYALDILLELDRQAGKEQITRAMQGHVLAEAQTMGTYQR